MGKRRKPVEHKKNKGIGLIIVLSAISLLTIIMVEFSYDSKINFINSNNMQARSQAKLNAEAGLRWTLLMMNIYKELYNKIEINENVKKVVPSETLDILWSTPFVYPIPSMKKSSLSQKETLQDFHENNFMQGNLNVTTRNLSGKLNLNLLRFSIIHIANQGHVNTLNDGDYYEEIEGTPTFTKRFKEMLKRIIKDELESDKKDTEYLENIDADKLVDNIIYYTTDPIVLSTSPCPTCTDSESDFNNELISAKKAPITSLSELYLIPGWNDKLVKLISNHVTVYGANIIDLSEITAEILKLIMPSLTMVEIIEFYEYKNNPDTLETFDTLDAIKGYFTSKTDVNADDFDKRVKELENSGIIFGSTAALFEVKSVGEVDRSSYVITAIISLPYLPRPLPKKKSDSQQASHFSGQQQTQSPDSKPNEKITYPEQLLKPRVIHLGIN